MEFLGHHITAEGAEPLQQKVAAIAEFQRPQDAKGMQRLLGMINFYRRFIQGAAGILRPLTDTLRGKPRGRVIWTAAMGEAFQAAKDALCAASRLAHPDPEAGGQLGDRCLQLGGGSGPATEGGSGLATASFLQQEAGQCAAQLLCV